MIINGIDIVVFVRNLNGAHFSFKVYHNPPDSSDRESSPQMSTEETPPATGNDPAVGGDDAKSPNIA